VRPFDLHLPAEVCRTKNASRTGLYFESSVGHYYAGMKVFVTWNIQPEDTDAAEVMRVRKLDDGRWGVAIHIL
jgi:hypothetical protein